MRSATNNFAFNFLNYPTDKAYPHTYAHIYDQYCDSIRDNVESVFEIGVYVGGSIKGWLDYFPKAHITGIDTNPDFVGEESLRVHTYLGDQSDPAILAHVSSLHGPFDIIVDDGSHDPRHQLKSLLYLWEHLKPGGVYFIEDIVTTGGIATVINSLPNIVDFMRLLPGTVYDFPSSPCKNDTIVVLKKEV